MLIRPLVSSLSWCRSVHGQECLESNKKRVSSTLSTYVRNSDAFFSLITFVSEFFSLPVWFSYGWLKPWHVVDIWLDGRRRRCCCLRNGTTLISFSGRAGFDLRDKTIYENLHKGG